MNAEVIDIQAEDEERPSRKVRDTNLKTYLLERVPRKLMDDAKAKARQQRKPLKLVIVELLSAWTYAG